MRRGAKEARVERMEEKVSDLVSERAYFAWRDKLQHRDFIGERDDKLQHRGFIGERDFNKLISPFQEIVESKG